MEVPVGRGMVVFLLFTTINYDQTVNIHIAAEELIIYRPFCSIPSEKLD